MLTSQNREKRRKQEGNWYLCTPLQTTIVYHVYTHTHMLHQTFVREHLFDRQWHILLYLIDKLHAWLIAYTKLTLSAGSWSSLNSVNIINILVLRKHFMQCLYIPLSCHSVSHASQAIMHILSSRQQEPARIVFTLWLPLPTWIMLYIGKQYYKPVEAIT